MRRRGEGEDEEKMYRRRKGMKQRWETGGGRIEEEEWKQGEWEREEGSEREEEKTNWKEGQGSRQGSMIHG